jgi:anti-sigma B factor antagonist
VPDYKIILKSEVKMSEQKTIIIEPHDQIILAVLQTTRMDEESARVIQAEILTAAAQTPDRPVVLDMSKVDFMPSLSLGVLVALVRKFKPENQRFILVGLQPAVRETLTLCRLIKVFEIYDTVGDALEKLNIQN